VRPLFRYIVNALTIVWLALFPVTLLLWARSYIAFDCLTQPTRVPVFVGDPSPGGEWSDALPTIYQLDSVKGRMRFLIARPTRGRLPWRELMTQPYVTLGPDDQGVDPFASKPITARGVYSYEFLGVAFRRGVASFVEPLPLRTWEVPYWLVMLVTATPFAWVMPALFRRRRRT
jgi:hypothetical protein